MKYIDEVLVTLGTLLILLILTSHYSWGAVSRADYQVIHTSCNQKFYDEIYRRAVRIALDSQPMTETEIALKNHAIQSLRVLCNGQKSSYETGKALE